MKKNNLLTAIFIVCTSFIFGQPQLPFTGYQNNPILEPGSAGAWDAGVAFTPNVLAHEGINYLFYTGGIDPFTQAIAIGYATSNDGFNFTKETISDPLFEADGTGFDAWSVNDPIVTIEGSTWVLYYGGVASSSEFMSKALGKATAPDVNGPWTRLVDPILEVGNPGEWDSFFIFPNSVISTPTGYMMYYWAGDAFPTGVWCIGLATSTDGLYWTKYDDPTTTSPPFADSDPVLKPGISGQWDESAIDACSVLETAHGYEMFYAGYSSSNSTSSIGYATSENGINWNKDMANNPIYSWFEDPYAYNNAHMILEIPTVCKISSTYYMYYDYGPTVGEIGMATAVALTDTIYVPADRPSIQSAIDFASDGDVIIVEDSTYYENISFMGKAITVASRFLIDGDESHIDNTIIDGSQAANPDSASTVMFVHGEDTTSFILDSP